MKVQRKEKTHSTRDAIKKYKDTKHISKKKLTPELYNFPCKISEGKETSNVINPLEVRQDKI